MPETFVNPILNLQVINSRDPKVLIVHDFSEWGFIKNKPAIIGIKPPGSREFFTYALTKNRVNVFNSNDLGITHLQACTYQDYADLPDGIYCITITGSPDTFTKSRYYLKTDILNMKVDKLYIKNCLEYSSADKGIRNIISDIEFLLSSADAFIIDGDIARAKRNYEEALNLTEQCQHSKYS